MTHTSSAGALQAHSLVKRYGRTIAVDRLSFEVAPGIVTGFLGPNGAGKSTTLRMFLGLDRPTSGAATIGGLRIAEIAHPMREVGALLDARAVHPRRTASDHLAAIARAGGVARERVDAALGTVGLADVGGRPVGEFSLGMKQRLGIAAALLGDPGILIFDEPLNGLDPEGIRWARALMRGLAADGRTVLFSSHLMGEMELTADHLIVIHRGRLLADQSIGAFVGDHAAERVDVRSPAPERLLRALEGRGLAPVARGGDLVAVPGATTDRIGRIAAEERIEVSELALRRDSLEDAFLSLTDTDGKAA